MEIILWRSIDASLSYTECILKVMDHTKLQAYLKLYRKSLEHYYVIHWTLVYAVEVYNG